MDEKPPAPLVRVTRPILNLARRALKMSCPMCFESGSSVVRSRGAIIKDEVHRRRQCAYCGGRFPTAEQVDLIAFAREQGLEVPPTWDEFEGLFHRAWGEAKEQEYDKDHWMAFQAMLDALKRQDPAAPHPR